MCVCVHPIGRYIIKSTFVAHILHKENTIDAYFILFSSSILPEKNRDRFEKWAENNVKKSRHNEKKNYFIYIKGGDESEGASREKRMF